MDPANSELQGPKRCAQETFLDTGATEHRSGSLDYYRLIAL
jgi:hypothetical protein